MAILNIRIARVYCFRRRLTKATMKNLHGRPGHILHGGCWNLSMTAKRMNLAEECNLKLQGSRLRYGSSDLDINNLNGTNSNVC